MCGFTHHNVLLVTPVIMMTMMMIIMTMMMIMMTMMMMTTMMIIIVMVITCREMAESKYVRAISADPDLSSNRPWKRLIMKSSTRARKEVSFKGNKPWVTYVM